MILCFLSYFSFLLASQRELNVKRYISRSARRRALGGYLYYMTFICIIIAVLSKITQSLVSVSLFTPSFCETHTCYIVYISIADSVSYSYTGRTYFVIEYYKISSSCVLCSFLLSLQRQYLVYVSSLRGALREDLSKFLRGAKRRIYGLHSTQKSYGLQIASI